MERSPRGTKSRICRRKFDASTQPPVCEFSLITACAKSLATAISHASRPFSFDFPHRFQLCWRSQLAAPEKSKCSSKKSQSYLRLYHSQRSPSFICFFTNLTSSRLPSPRYFYFLSLALGLFRTPPTSPLSRKRSRPMVIRLPPRGIRPSRPLSTPTGREKTPTLSSKLRFGFYGLRNLFTCISVRVTALSHFFRTRLRPAAATTFGIVTSSKSFFSPIPLIPAT